MHPPPPGIMPPAAPLYNIPRQTTLLYTPRDHAKNNLPQHQAMYSHPTPPSSTFRLLPTLPLSRICHSQVLPLASLRILLAIPPPSSTDIPPAAPRCNVPRCPTR